MSALQVAPDEPARWEALQRGLSVPLHDGLISQFAGYEDLAELDWFVTARRTATPADWI